MEAPNNNDDDKKNSWSSEANLAVAYGSLDTSITFHSSDSPIELEIVNSTVKFPLNLKPSSPGCRPCEIKNQDSSHNRESRKGQFYTPNTIVPAVEVTRSLRDVQPADYLFKIESFSTLLESEIEKHETNDFEACGYKWKLAFYPNGDKKRNVQDHISLYLVITDVDKLPLGWEVNVSFKFFVFDHIQDKYLAIEETGQVRRFHRMKTEWGLDQFLSLDTLKNASNGYLVNDSCVFGAEVFVIRHGGKGECLTMKKELYNNIYTWRVDNFSTLSKGYIYSDEFKINEWKWKLCLYAKGDDLSDGRSLSLYLEIVDWEKLPVSGKLYAKYKLRVKDQVNSKHHEREGDFWFSRASYCWGFRDFMLLSNLSDLSKGFLVKDNIMVEVELLTLYVINNFT